MKKKYDNVFRTVASILSMESGVMTVTKRDGSVEPVRFDKILERIQRLGEDLMVNYHELSRKIIDQLHDGISTSKLDDLTAEQCAMQNTDHPDYGIMAGRLVVSNHQKETSACFSDAVTSLSRSTDAKGASYSVVASWYVKLVEKHADIYNAMVIHDRDYLISYFGFKTLLKSYLLRIRNVGKTVVVERPQYMWLRVAIHLHKDDFDAVKETYELMSTLHYTHATPTLFNSATPRPQLSSCYLLAMKDDSIEGIFDTLKESALISKWAGGQGMHIHNIRGSYSHIKGTNGESNGIVPMLRVFNNAVRYVDQGGGKRPGALAIYLSPDHYDIMSWLDLRKNHGSEEERARDLFYGLWIPDLFMERVASGGSWTVMCPNTCPGLADVCGEAYKQLYEEYEEDVEQGKRYGKKLKARDVWFKVLDSQIETGTPYMLYKDACNLKSNQQNLGAIKSSNLCTEIIEYSDENETAVCNLASISLSKFASLEEFDFVGLHRTAKLAAKNLDRVIDINFYPVEETERSNIRHRPVGLGVQGLADAFMIMKYPFESSEASQLNKDIFETIYHAAIEASWELAVARKNLILPHLPQKRLHPENSTTTVDRIRENCNISYIIEEIEKLDADRCGAYSSFIGSPASDGKLQFDLWGVEPSTRYDWSLLKQRVQEDGIRNSLSVAPMPTASTAQILGNNEAFEPVTSNMYVRRVGSGDFPVINKYLLSDLISIGKWNKETKGEILRNHGSVQSLDIPTDMKELYKTAWEIKMKSLIGLSVDRAPYICQSQSLNLWMEEPTYAQLTAMHMHSWRSGLKTGMYYLRTKAKASPQQFTVEPVMEPDCEMCSA
jgi:ribonucleotide reductase alpha subunit